MGLGSDWRGDKLRSRVPDGTERWVPEGELFLLCYLAQQASIFISRKLLLEDLGHCVVTLLRVQMSVCTPQLLVSSQPFFSDVTG